MLCYTSLIGDGDEDEDGVGGARGSGKTLRDKESQQPSSEGEWRP